MIDFETMTTNPKFSETMTIMEDSIMVNRKLLQLTMKAADEKAADLLIEAAQELTAAAQTVDRASKTTANTPLGLALQIVFQDILEQADTVTEAARIAQKGAKKL